MPFKKYLCIFISLLCIFFSSCANADTKFENFTLQLFQTEVSSNTINLHYSLKNPAQYGITEYPITFGSFEYNETSQLAYFENLIYCLDSFPYHSLSKENQLTYDVLSYYINTAKEGSCFYLYEEPLSPTTGVHAQLPILLAEYPFYSTEDVETYLELLYALPEYFESLLTFEKHKSEAGLFMSNTIANEVINECNTFLKMGENNYLLSTFEERVSDFESKSYVKQNQKAIEEAVIPAYEALANGLSKLKDTGKNENGLCNLPEGQEYYKYLVRDCTGSSRNIDELKSLIQNQIAQDMIDMKNVSVQTASQVPQSPKEILSTLQNKISTVFPKVPNVHVEIKEVPAALENQLSPAFYLVPPMDNCFENIIYLNNSYNLDNISLFTTLAHEGYPGHLYQTTYYASTNPHPIRNWMNFVGYTEGWATYAEMCSYYISPLEKSQATILQKNSSVILGLYALADIGIHYEGWDLADTINFFGNYGIDDQDVVEEIYKIILGDPANYLSYYVGYIEILELKKEYEGSQMEFHKELLEIGPAPFTVIKKYL